MTTLVYWLAGYLLLGFSKVLAALSFVPLDLIVALLAFGLIFIGCVPMVRVWRIR